MISFLILLQRFVRAEGRADEAFWICTCKLLPPELWRAALGARQSGRTCPKGSGTAASGTGNKPEDLGSDALTSQGGSGEEGASGQVNVFLTLFLPTLPFVAASWIRRWAVFTFKTHPFCTALFLSLAKLWPSTAQVEKHV